MRLSSESTPPALAVHPSLARFALRKPGRLFRSGKPGRRGEPCRLKTSLFEAFCHRNAKRRLIGSGLKCLVELRREAAGMAGGSSHCKGGPSWRLLTASWGVCQISHRGARIEPGIRDEQVGAEKKPPLRKAEGAWLIWLPVRHGLAFPKPGQRVVRTASRRTRAGLSSTPVSQW